MKKQISLIPILFVFFLLLNVAVANDFYIENGLDQYNYKFIKETSYDDCKQLIYENDTSRIVILTGDKFLQDDLKYDTYNETTINNVSGYITYDNWYHNYRFIHELDNGSLIAFDADDMDTLGFIVVDYWEN